MIRGIAWNIKRRRSSAQVYDELCLLFSYQPDFVCLQEVDFPAPFFHGYKQDQENSKNIIKKVTYYDKSTWYEYRPNVTTSASFIVFLRNHFNGTQLTVANLHLKAGLHTFAEQRAKQLTSCLKACQQGENILLCGDFNDDMDSSSTLRPMFMGCKLHKATCSTVIYSKFDWVVLLNNNNYSLQNVKVMHVKHHSDHDPIIFTMVDKPGRYVAYVMVVVVLLFFLYLLGLC
jgi:endonuclease/exonuclease/phosphatase (EEP) superfamily protein YafD